MTYLPDRIYRGDRQRESDNAKAPSAGWPGRAFVRGSVGRDSLAGDTALLALELGDLALDAQSDRVGAANAPSLTDAGVRSPRLVVDPNDPVWGLAIAARCHGNTVASAYALSPRVSVRGVGVGRTRGADNSRRLHMHNDTRSDSVMHMHFANDLAMIGA